VVEIENVQPVVSCVAYPPSGVSGEVVPVRPRLARECQDAVAATLVGFTSCLVPARHCTPPESRRCRPAPEKEWPIQAAETQALQPQLIPMTMGSEPYAFHGHSPPTASAVDRGSMAGVTRSTPGAMGWSPSWTCPGRRKELPNDLRAAPRCSNGRRPCGRAKRKPAAEGARLRICAPPGSVTPHAAALTPDIGTSDSFSRYGSVTLASSSRSG